MTADRLASRAASSEPSGGPSRTAAAPQWRRDVVDGVTRRFALVVVPALLLGVTARVLSADWDIAIVATITMVAAAATLNRGASLQVRVGLVVGVFVFANTALVFLARDIPFHGILMPMGAAFAALVGGLRLGLWTLAALSAPWIVPIALVIAGRPSLVDLPQPVHALRLWLLYTGLAAGVVAAIHHVIRSLEASLDDGDELRNRLEIERRAAQALAGRVTEAEERRAEPAGARAPRRLRSAPHRALDEAADRPDHARPACRCGRRAAPPSPNRSCATSEPSLTGCGRRCSTKWAGSRAPGTLSSCTRGSPAVSVAIDGPEPIATLPRSTELAAYRVFQEALTNVDQAFPREGHDGEMRHRARANR